MRNTRPSPTLAKRVVLGSALGFLVPIFWGMMSFVSFNARNSRWTDLYWNLVYITSPPWALPANSWSTWITPIANAFLYGLAAFLILTAFRALKTRRR